MKDKIIELNHIVHGYGNSHVLKVDNLSVVRGEVFALLGPNGAGKSTLLRIIGLLEQPLQGQVLFKGQDVTKQRAKLELRRKMTMVFQESLLFRTSVYENVASGLKFRGLKRQEIEQRVKRWLSIMDIEHLAKRPAHQLSGGEAQRTSFARALAVEPEICLLDEPLSGLDLPTRERLQEELQSLLHRLEMTTIYVTHDRNEALMLADRVGIIINGELIQTGAPAEVFSAPLDERVARFVGVETICRGK